MKHYVLGFLFDSHYQYVVLIRKQRPAWQMDKLNGVGGHIEEDELPLDAMIREFKEETGLEISNWKHFATMERPDDFSCYCFESSSSHYLRTQTLTDEPIEVYRTDDIPDDALTNLHWLIPLAMDNEHHRPQYIKY